MPSDDSLSEIPLKGQLPLSSKNLHSDTDTTVTNSSDEFDWDEDEGFKSKEEHVMARRGRALWIAFMRLSKFLRVLLIGVLVAGILITPMLVVELRFKHSPARPQVRFWSLWLSISWGVGCMIYLLVDAIPYLVLSAMLVFGAQVERMKIQLEVLPLLGWSMTILNLGSIAGNGRFWLAEVNAQHIRCLDNLVYHPGDLSSPRSLLGHY